MQRPPLRLLHCADLHFAVNAREDSIDLAAAVRTLAAERGADCIVMAGDVFDSASQPDAFVDDIAEELSRSSVPIVAVPGNHDIQYSSYDGDPFARLFGHLRGSAVALVSHAGEELTMADGRLHLWGRGMPEHTPDNDPLQGLPELDGDRRGAWRVAVAHGYLVETPNGRSSPILPMRHREALATFDYLALGHRHLPTQVTFEGTLITDSGSGCSTAGHRSYALVDFEDESVTSTIHELPLPGRPPPKPTSVFYNWR
jgi:DNA repair exonuclease SbcCD nuclease subunit